MPCGRRPRSDASFCFFCLPHHKYGCFPYSPPMGVDLFLPLSSPGGFRDDLSDRRPRSLLHRIVSVPLHFPPPSVPVSSATVAEHRAQTSLLSSIFPLVIKDSHYRSLFSCKWPEQCCKYVMNRRSDCIIEPE